jgi:putative heme-binding domain-containing protein
VSYIGSSDKSGPSQVLPEPILSQAKGSGNADARGLRRELGDSAGRKEEDRIVFDWACLTDEDRFLSFAARGRLEEKPPAQWRDLALGELHPRAGLHALLALARVGEKADEEPLLKALAKWPLDSLDEPMKLLKLRVIQVAFARHGRPSDETAALAIEKLSKQYPAPTFALNRELSQLLVWLTNPALTKDSANEKAQSAARDVIERTNALLEKSTIPEEQIWYAYCLRAAAPEAWTPAQRERFFAWFPKATTFKGGNSAQKFITRIRDLALAGVPQTERPHFATLAERKIEAPKTAAAPPRPFVQNWSVADLEPDLGRVAKGRNFARGKAMYAAARCSVCHLFAGEGGNIGPDLTAAASRYNRRDLLESIIDPNKGISEQYAVFHVTQFDGKKELAGMIVEETNDSLTVLVDPLNGTRDTIGKFKPPTREMLPVSPMPPGLLNTLNRDEILDLLAYIESAGNADAALFK